MGVLVSMVALTPRLSPAITFTWVLPSAENVDIQQVPTYCRTVLWLQKKSILSAGMKSNFGSFRCHVSGVCVCVCEGGGGGRGVTAKDTFLVALNKFEKVT